MDDDKAATVAEVLLGGDLLGHNTHGLALAAPYLGALEDGGMTRDGEPAVVSDLGGALCWDGRRLPGPWLVVRAIDQAYDLALTVEALSQGLSGHGRADAPTGWGASVYVQIMEPRAFGGATSFARRTGFIAAACRSNPPAPGVDAVRLPGERALALKRRALADGVRLYPGIMSALQPWAARLSVALPRARG